MKAGGAGYGGRGGEACGENSTYEPTTKTIVKEETVKRDTEKAKDRTIQKEDERMKIEFWRNKPRPKHILTIMGNGDVVISGEVYDAAKEFWEVVNEMGANYGKTLTVQRDKEGG